MIDIHQSREPVPLNVQTGGRGGGGMEGGGGVDRSEFVTIIAEFWPVGVVVAFKWPDGWLEWPWPFLEAGRPGWPTVGRPEKWPPEEVKEEWPPEEVKELAD